MEEAGGLGSQKKYGEVPSSISDFLPKKKVTRVICDPTHRLIGGCLESGEHIWQNSIPGLFPKK